MEVLPQPPDAGVLAYWEKMLEVGPPGKRARGPTREKGPGKGRPSKQRGGPTREKGPAGEGAMFQTASIQALR